MSDDELKKSRFAVFSNTGRFLKGPTLARERKAVEAASPGVPLRLPQGCGACGKPPLDVYRIPFIEEEPTEIVVKWDDGK